MRWGTANPIFLGYGLYRISLIFLILRESSGALPNCGLMYLLLVRVQRAWLYFAVRSITDT